MMLLTLCGGERGGSAWDPSRAGRLWRGTAALQRLCPRLRPHSQEGDPPVAQGAAARRHTVTTGLRKLTSPAVERGPCSLTG